jgi:hypothetical protein
VDGVTRTEVRRLLSPVERWFWIVDQVTPLNVIARVRLTGRLFDAQFISGVLPFGYLVATVNISHGDLFWNFAYVDGAVPYRSAQRCADGCLQTLLRAIA